MARESRRGQALTLTVTGVRRDSVTIPGMSLLVTTPSGRTLEIALGLDAITIGTDEACDVAVDDPHASRRHCTMRLTEHGLELVDLESKNGTFVDEVRIARAWLSPSAVVRFGETRLALRRDPEDAVLPLSAAARFGEALGGSLSMRALFARLGRVATTTDNVLLIGESGTGKELLARGLHEAGDRADGPFVVLDCGAVTPTLVESELFGHARGAFTGAVHAKKGILAEAEGGTIFLDEIGELPLDMQPKLLRALEARAFKPVGSNQWSRFDARVVSATHRDLRALVARGAYREDLYYRLAVVEMRVPPLRERPEDIELLVERMLAAMNPTRTVLDLFPSAMSMLKSHDWPGNVRELKNVVTRMVLFPEAGRGAFDDDEESARPPTMSLQPLREARERVVEDFERHYIKRALREHDGNVTKAAAALGVSRQLLHRLLIRHGITGGGED